MTTQPPPSARAEFEALCDEYYRVVTAINNGQVGLIRGTVEREQILSKLFHLVFANRATIAAALDSAALSDEQVVQEVVKLYGLDALPDDWRPRADSDGD